MSYTSSKKSRAPQIQQFPYQKLPDSRKGEKWAKECVDVACDIFLYHNENIRASQRNKIINYNLFSGIIDHDDVEKLCDPHQLGIDDFKDTFRHMGIGNNLSLIHI